MTAPSNANTSGLSETWARLSKTFSDRFYEGYEPEIEAMSAAVVTAASAQARIAELEALVASIRRAQRDVVRAEIEQEGYAPISDANDRVTAAEARADRLAKALADLVDQDLTYNGAIIGIPASSHANAIALIQRARAALQQETQP